MWWHLHNPRAAVNHEAWIACKLVWMYIIKARTKMRTKCVIAQCPKNTWDLGDLVEGPQGRRWCSSSYQESYYVLKYLYLCPSNNNKNNHRKQLNYYCQWISIYHLWIFKLERFFLIHTRNTQLQRRLNEFVLNTKQMSSNMYIKLAIVISSSSY